MITENVRLTRWREVVLCLAGVVAMTKTLASGVSLYRAALAAAVKNYSSLYGWVEESGAFNANERWRGEQRLRVLGYPRQHFTPAEVEQAAAEVRALGMAEIRRLRVEERERADRAAGDRAVAGLMVAIGAGGVGFYCWLGYALMHQPCLGATPTTAVVSRSWLGKRRRNGRITFGRLAA